MSWRSCRAVHEEVPARSGYSTGSFDIRITAGLVQGISRHHERFSDGDTSGPGAINQKGSSMRRRAHWCHGGVATLLFPAPKGRVSVPCRLR